MGLGYLETQLKIQVHMIMLTITGILFTIGVGVFVFDFFRVRPSFVVHAGAPPPETREMVGA
jgi:nitric oxide reductase subunit B